MMSVSYATVTLPVNNNNNNNNLITTTDVWQSVACFSPGLAVSPPTGHKRRLL